MTHGDSVERYPGTLAELAEELGNLRYDALASFLAALAAKLEGDSVADADCGRKQLAAVLKIASSEIAEAAGSIEKVWTICKPHM